MSFGHDIQYRTNVYTQEEINRSRQKLLEYCPVGTTLYCFITDVRATTPRYEIAVIVPARQSDSTDQAPAQPGLINITIYIHILLGYRYYDNPYTTNGIQVSGLYYADIVQNLAEELHGDMNALTPYRM